MKKHESLDPFRDREAERYTQPIASREYILEQLSKQAAPLTYSQLVALLQIESQEDRDALRKRLKAMVRDGQIIKNRRAGYVVASELSFIAGKVMGHADGYGFLVPDEGSKDLYLPFSEMRQLFHGDRALCRIVGEDAKGRLEGAIVDVLTRNTQKLVGKLKHKDNIYFVTPENPRISHDIILADKPNRHQVGQWVEVVICEPPTKRRPPVGQVVETLGRHMDLQLATQLVVREYDLPEHWPESALNRAQRCQKKLDTEASDDRKDLRDKYFVTIDGEDAKDFDDAIYCESQNAGGWQLYVAIADVSHYVKHQDALDKEAFNRGNSVYFPHRVIPMLPETLSNGLCSLKPDENRLVLVCQMSVNAEGKVTRHRFYRALIRSHQRFTYTQVSAILEQQDDELKNQFADALPHLNALFSLYQQLYAGRQIRGAIDFDSTEAKVELDDNLQILNMGAVQRNQAHRLIEECMLAANVSAAKYLNKHKMPTLYRNHLGPSSEKLQDLKTFLKSLGLDLAGGNQPQPKHYSALISQVKTRPDRHLIETVLLRSLSQAVYEADNQSHFGLAYKEYTHFTSPIRRYPDLIVHRAICHLIDGGSAENFVYDTERMESMGEHCSYTERRADEAGWALMDWIKCQFMLDKLGQEFDGCITGVTNFGLFVELTETYIQGLVHVTSLGQEYFEFDPIHHRLNGRRTGIHYQLGQTIRIKVAAVDIETKKIDFVLADSSTIETRKPLRKKKSKGKKRKR